MSIDEASKEVKSEEPEVNKMDLLKQKADVLGISYHPSIGEEKLLNKINAKMKQTAKPVEKPKPETPAQKNMRMRKDATKLVRVRVTCMNPNKKDWPGEIFTVSNAVVGTIKKYVPFNADAGYHVPSIVLTMMKDRKYQQFKKVKLPNGQEQMKGSLVKEFNIEIMEPLTPEEIDELKTQQALNHSIDR